VSCAAKAAAPLIIGFKVFIFSCDTFRPRANSSSMNTSLALCFALTLCSGSALAQWSSDPANTTLIAGGAGDQATPQLGLGAGKVWVEFTDASGAGGIKYAVQQLDEQGNVLLSTPLVVSPARTNTASFVHDLDVNSAGQAFVAYDDNGIWLQRVEANGSPAWSGNGVFLAGSTGSLGPRVAAFADGSAVVCFASGTTLNIRRINADGSAGASFTIDDPGRSVSPSDMLALGGQEFALLWIRGETTSFLSRKGLRLQKYDATNAPMWNSGAPMDIYTSSAAPLKSIQNGYFPALVPDNEGGAIVSWYDNGAARNAWIQHVIADGTVVFPAEGLAASGVSSATQLRLSASVAFHRATRSYTVAFMRSNTLQSQFGLTAQRISDEGDLVWGPSGVDIVPTGATQSSFINVADADGDAIVTWLQYAGANGPMGVLAHRLTSAGSPAWTPANLIVATNTTNKGRLSALRVPGEQSIIATWGDGATGSQDVRAMRFNFDGTLGNPTPRCDSIDFNNNSLFPEDQDLIDFLNVFAGGACSTNTCNTIDFNRDGLFPDDNDVVAFLRVLAGGDC
jgi:hypothetical protein